jgi:hypothetical protein
MSMYRYRYVQYVQQVPFAFDDVIHLLDSLDYSFLELAWDDILYDTGLIFL